MKKKSNNITKTEALKDIQNAIKKYETAKEVKTEPQPGITKEDMLELISQIKGDGKKPEPKENAVPYIAQQPQQPQPTSTLDQPYNPPPQQQQRQPTVRETIAFQIWKDQKSITIISLIAVIIPMITILIAMGGQGMMALMIGFIGMIYPLITFMKSMNVQNMLYKKYGLKPILNFRPPMQQIPLRQQQPNQPQKQQNKGGLI